MPYKDYEQAKQRMRANYHARVHGTPAPPKRVPLTHTQIVERRKAHAALPAIQERRRDLELQRSYGITWARKVEMYQEQRGLCGLCHLPLDPEISKAHTDHNHETGKVRKLLHKQCNSVVAYFEEDSARINSLLDYLVM